MKILFTTLAVLCSVCLGSAETPATHRSERDNMVKRGLWKDALDRYRDNLITIADQASGDDLRCAIDSLRNLNAWKQFDPLVEQAVTAQPKNPHLLRAAANAYQSAPHAGRVIAGEFERIPHFGRGHYRGGRRGGPQIVPEATGGAMVQTQYRDRIRSLQLLWQALESSKKAAEKSYSWETIADALMQQGQSWKLQTLTPIETLPEWGEPGPDGGTEGAPWDDDAPVLYDTPKSWAAAKNDGERWRFALAERTRLDRDHANDEILRVARFSESQFSVSTLSSYGWTSNHDPDTAQGIMQVETLGEDECLAKTSDGIRRFKLPPEHHFIALYKKVFDYSAASGDALTQIFLNRRQYHKAREVLERTIKKHGPGSNDRRQKLLAQITGNWGRFETAETVSSGNKPLVPLVFRNAESISLTASPVDIEALLTDTIAYLKSNPKKFDYQRTNPTDVARQILQSKQSKYIGEIAKKWTSDLSPRELHRDTRTIIKVPLEKAGAWWITGKMKNGNEFHTLIWIIDSILMQRSIDGKLQWWLADAETGAPVREATIDFFGYRVESINRKTPLERKINVKWKEFSRTTDEEGKTLLKPGDWENQFQWLAVAKSGGRFPAYSGFRRLYAQHPPGRNNTRNQSFAITDRPIYKPGDTVHLKFHLRNVGYADQNERMWANQIGELKVFNGRGEETMKIENLKTDDLGTVTTEFIIPKDAALGNWRAQFMIPKRFSSQASFRVEEYRKPEFEVAVEAPDEPVRLGDTFTAKVKANYFHGAPVRNAEIELTVKRSSVTEPWFPSWRWDWLYEPGAWWIQCSAEWHPTWHRWGCIPPSPPWWGGNNRWTPDGLILKKTIPIGNDGTASVEIDTSTAKEIHGDMDARYSIEARVVDASRREERGTGSVIAARKPFEVTVWTDRGHSKIGDQIEATIAAATLTGKPVAKASGALKLFRLSMSPEGKINEKEIQSWPISTDAEGRTTKKFAAPESGQYRLAANLSLDDGEAVESATILNIHGPDDDSKDWNFGPLELVADKSEYRPGETVKLRINSDQEQAHVWLFLRVKGSAGSEAKLVQLNGKSLEIDVPVTLEDMPNMFIEGITVHGADIHSAVRQILLPPVSKLINVTLEPAKDRVKPGEKSSLAVTLRNEEGKPVSGSTAITIYDKSLEALNGGSNIGPIKKAFWDWKNYYASRRYQNSLPHSTGNLLRPKVTGMRTLGRFGDQPMEGFSNGTGSGGGMIKAGAGFGRMAKREMLFEEAAPMAAMAMESDSIVTAGNRSGDAAIARNNIDAMLNGGENPITVRTDFADLLKWAGTVRTDENGRAEIPLEFPDNLTTWKARVWHLGKGSTVGEGSAEIIASKELLVRLQAPRFLVERDESIFSAVVHNDHNTPKTVRVSLELEGGIEGIETKPRTVEIAARAEARVDWRVRAVKEGEATIRMKADTGEDGDAVERKLPVLVHGMSRQDAWSVVIDPEKNSAVIDCEVPEQRRPDQSLLTVRYSPTVAGAIVDAIPYLASYPHGCTEQTLNRFVPLVIAQGMLRDLDLNLDEIRTKRTNLNAQELGDASRRAAQWEQWKNNPVFDSREMEKMTTAGIERLMQMQVSDGGWGWFSGYREKSYPHTTAVVVHGMLIAKANGADIPDRMLDAGIAWLQAYEKKQIEKLQRYVEYEALREEGKTIKNQKPTKATCDSMDAFTRMVLGEAERDSEPMLAFLHRDRVGIPVYAKCLIALEHHRRDDIQRRDEVMRMIEQYLKRDEENQTAYLDLKNSGYWWFWYGSEIEAHAWYLKLLSAVKPKDPDTRGLVKYLVNNRKHASYWNSTRDTAYAIEAIASYFKASGEMNPDLEVELLVDGNSQRKVKITRDNLFTFDGTFTLEGEDITSGHHKIELRKTGTGPLYANTYLEVFTLEDKLRAAGLEVKVQRRISKLIELEKESEVPDSSGLVVKQQEERFRREPLADGATVKSGDRIEVELVLESKNDYEYLLFSDSKAAGSEALEALSGYISGDGGFSAYMEPRDETVDFFIRALPRGTHTLHYQLRAEAPGTYKALPATASAMYAPELRGNSEDQKLTVE